MKEGNNGPVALASGAAGRGVSTVAGLEEGCLLGQFWVSGTPVESVCDACLGMRFF